MDEGTRCLSREVEDTLQQTSSSQATGFSDILGRAAVLGGGAWGTAMANHLAKKGTMVSLWAREEEVINGINQSHENSAFLPGVQLSSNVVGVPDVAKAVEGAELLLLVIPTPFIKKWLEQHSCMLPWNVPLACLSKGIDESSLRTPYEILVDELPGKYHAQLSVVGGPSFAKEVAEGLPTSVTCAAKDARVARQVQMALSTRSFRVYTVSDVVGAELCGAVKNVLAIACGASDGCGFGANARAALITRGLAEMARLVVKKGGKASTVAGLAGLGDLVLTCSSSLSRNYSVGHSLATGVGSGAGSGDVVLKSVAEGVKSSLAIHQLMLRQLVDMPICDAVYRVIHEGVSIQAALQGLQERPLRSEDDWNL
eukprot:TRINITY_DN4865_c0_g1_i1.p1 TRINITY_DN4865_c0_g1~~TRINITY_DN4865_c0_g1_i1.p1  ORF type:complete len:370 (-),score=66.65 TRINITY_DN4865_c0_g1_i1:74-1183(-)